MFLLSFSSIPTVQRSAQASPKYVQSDPSKRYLQLFTIGERFGRRRWGGAPVVFCLCLFEEGLEGSVLKSLLPLVLLERRDPAIRRRASDGWQQCISVLHGGIRGVQCDAFDGKLGGAAHLSCSSLTFTSDIFSLPFSPLKMPQSRVQRDASRLSALLSLHSRFLHHKLVRPRSL